MKPLPRPRYNKKGRAATITAEAERASKRKGGNYPQVNDVLGIEGDTQSGDVKGKRKISYHPDDEDSQPKLRYRQSNDFSNAEIIDPVLAKKRKDEVKALKDAALLAQPEEKMSSKKRKRFEAFVRRKLKKEDRQELIASLAKTQSSNNLLLRSSSSLGSKQFTNQAARLAYSETVEERRRQRARKTLVKVRGAPGGKNLSDSEEGISAEEEEEQQRDIRQNGIASRHLSDGKNEESSPISNEARSEMTGIKVFPSHSQKRPASFNASGSLGVFEAHASPSSTSSPPLKPEKVVPTVGGGLKSDVTILNVTRITRKPKKSSRMRALMSKEQQRSRGGKFNEEEDEEEDESDFDSSDSSVSANGKEDKALDNDNDESSSEHSSLDLNSDDESIEERDEKNLTESATGETAATLPPRKKGAFQAWAESQLQEAAGTESMLPIVQESEDNIYKPLLAAGSGVRPAADPSGITGPLGEVLTTSQLPSLPAQRSTYIPIDRSDSMQRQRADLPIVKEEDRIMDAIRGHAVVVICGETGSGKTTQIGQFLWEAGWGDASSDNPGMIAITQPRRVAAVSTSARVRAELCLPSTSTLVAHRIRYSSTASADTKMVFMTDGVLLRELARDFLLSKYSVIIVDEAHERGVNTDVLIGVLSRVARLRQEMWKKGEGNKGPLRLIIMSATLRVSDFAENRTLFSTAPPVLEVKARQHPVTVHFSRRTKADYLDQAFRKVARIHARLPPGGILVFCTGQNEIVSLVKKLEKQFGPKAIADRKAKAVTLASREKSRQEYKEQKKQKREEEERDDEQASMEYEQDFTEAGEEAEVEDIDLGENRDLAADVDDGDFQESDPEDLESSEDEDLKSLGINVDDDVQEPMFVLPLYSLLPTEKQMRVFKEPPPNTRLVIVATNVAETSITIPNIKYVVDTGRAKERHFDVNSGIQSFEVKWVSKASAAQRTGRAGRTAPGHCYRLYSSAVFNNYFDQHTKPEILRMPIEGIVLQMKSMNIDAVANFPFPTPPNRDSLRRSEKTLVHLGALEASDSSSKVGGKITELGRSMALFPLSPRFSKMIVAGQQHGCLPYVIAIVCALSVGDPFVRETNLGDDGEDDTESIADKKALTAAEINYIRDPVLRAKEQLKVTRRSFFEVQKRHAALGKGVSDVFKMLSVVGAYEYASASEAFCEANFVRPKAMQEIHKLRTQISRIVQLTYPKIDAVFIAKLAPPSDLQLKVLRQLLTSAFIDQVAVRKDLVDTSNSLSYSKVSSTRGVPYRSLFGVNEDLFIHPSSELFHHSPPEFIIFQELQKTTKVWLKVVTKINPAWLPTLGKPLCTFSKPLQDSTAAIKNAAKKHNESTEGSTRETFVTPRFGEGVGIELKPIMVRQKMVQGRWIFE